MSLKLLLVAVMAAALAAAVVPNDVTYGTFPGYWSTTGGTNIPDAYDFVPVGTDLYILHTTGCVRKMTGPDAVSVFAGIASCSYATGPSAEGTGTAARLAAPRAMEAVSGSLLVTAKYGVLRVDLSTAAVVLFAGSLSTGGAVNGAGDVARFQSELSGLAVVGGNVVVSDFANHALRLIVNGGAGLTGAASTRTVSTYAGLLGTSGDANGAAGTARFNGPRAVRLNPVTQVLAVADKGFRVRFVSTAPSVSVTTAAATALNSYTIAGLEWNAAGNTLFYLASSFGQTSHFAVVDPAPATLLAGSLALFDSTDVKAVGLAARIYRGIALRRVGAGSFLVGSQYTINTITVA